MRIFADRSIVEIFIQDGEAVFTSRVFPLAESAGIKLFSDGQMKYSYDLYELSRGISL
ncbi:MAG: GH32 C-terminal domain-containing protein [Ectobacillus sp.]